MPLQIAVLLIKRNYNSLETFISGLEVLLKILYLWNTTWKYSLHLIDRLAKTKSDLWVANINFQKKNCRYLHMCLL